jgi:hypothetical protein
MSVAAWDSSPAPQSLTPEAHRALASDPSLRTSVRPSEKDPVTSSSRHHWPARLRSGSESLAFEVTVDASAGPRARGAAVVLFHPLLFHPTRMSASRLEPWPGLSGWFQVHRWQRPRDPPGPAAIARFRGVNHREVARGQLSLFKTQMAVPRQQPHVRGPNAAVSGT